MTRVAGQDAARFTQLAQERHQQQQLSEQARGKEQHQCRTRHDRGQHHQGHGQASSRPWQGALEEEQDHQRKSAGQEGDHELGDASQGGGKAGGDARVGRKEQHAAQELPGAVRGDQPHAGSGQGGQEGPETADLLDRGHQPPPLRALQSPVQHHQQHQGHPHASVHIGGGPIAERFQVGDTFGRGQLRVQERAGQDEDAPADRPQGPAGQAHGER